MNRQDLIMSVGEEVLTPDELTVLLEKKHFTAYDGFEPSGNIHIAQGILRAININKMIKAGAKFKMLVADWHGWANNKMGGDLDKIQTVGKYMIEVWKASDMDLSKVEFVWASDMVKDDSYWKKVMQISRSSTIKRVIRCGQIMGRREADVQQSSQVLYPLMQCADIFHLEADVCQLGMDQRKVNMLARELGPKLGFWKPLVVSHHMLMGLLKPVSNTQDAVGRAVELKMSKSNPSSAIFMTDSEEEIARKIRKAYCPEKQVEENPILEYCRYIIFEKFSSLKIERPAKWGGDLTFSKFDDLSLAYSKGEVHPMDLKDAVTRYINELITPVRKHFSSGHAKELLEEVKSFEVTR